MKYIKKFEKSRADMLRRKYIGKYIILKATPYSINFHHENLDDPIYFLVYLVPGTSDGYLYRTYTALVIGYKDTKSEICLDENMIKNIKKYSFSHELVLNLNLEKIDEIVLYTTKKYNDAVEKLGMIDEINKYNL